MNLHLGIRSYGCLNRNSNHLTIYCAALLHTAKKTKKTCKGIGIIPHNKHRKKNSMKMTADIHSG